MRIGDMKKLSMAIEEKIFWPGSDINGRDSYFFSILTITFSVTIHANFSTKLTAVENAPKIARCR